MSGKPTLHVYLKTMLLYQWFNLVSLAITRRGLFQLVPAVESSLLLLAQVWSLLQEPVWDPALTDTLKHRQVFYENLETKSPDLYKISTLEKAWLNRSSYRRHPTSRLTVPLSTVWKSHFSINLLTDWQTYTKCLICTAHWSGHNSRNNFRCIQFICTLLHAPDFSDKWEKSCVYSEMQTSSRSEKLPFLQGDNNRPLKLCVIL